ncbi:histone-lysine N-methyltransferase EHMT2-like [Ptychodera flava]|uniref:histone-lysine N-methyltransferase EHMT2-like n=1 Tax=Ptychodera flava TaxID=63121 RepID=UPI00396A39A2
MANIWQKMELFFGKAHSSKTKSSSSANAEKNTKQEELLHSQQKEIATPQKVNKNGKSKGKRKKDKDDVDKKKRRKEKKSRRLVSLESSDSNSSCTVSFSDYPDTPMPKNKDGHSAELKERPSMVKGRRRLLDSFLEESTDKQIDSVICRDISRDRERIPVPVVNNVDTTPAPDDFLYITNSCETQPLYVDANITNLSACDCEDECMTSSCSCAVNSVQCWYGKDGRLVSDLNILTGTPLIFECNRRCRCYVSKCFNRVVQKGMQYQLQIYRTEKTGWGIRSMEFIPRGSFVCEYVGELITDEQADLRADTYLFDLENKNYDVFCLDGRYYGNVSRFINHSCHPNIAPLRVFVEHQDLRCPRVAFFACTDIAAYEQLG